MTARRTLTAALLALGLGLAGCGSDDDSSADTTVAEIAETTLAAAPDTEAAVDTTVAADTDAAVDTTAAPLDSLVPEAADAVLDAALIQALTGLGVPDATAASACIRKEAPGLTVESLSGGEPTPAFMRGLIRCAGDTMAASAGDSLEVPGVTAEQKTCAAKAMLKVIGDQSDEVLATLLATSDAKDFPADVKDAIVKEAGSCGIADDVLKKAIEEG
jgi:hypothetical protein